ncbi:fimbrial protein [Hafnia sp.]|uniref:fimbrial protein n=1 Tax=Hafnia sp. TaxID=1873498 RepID=UPI002FC5CD02
MKKNRFILPALWSSTVLLAFPALADSFGSNQVGGSLNSTITMTVATPTCALDDSAQTVGFADITANDLRTASRHLPAGAVLSCDFIPSGISLTLVPVGSASVDNVVRPGVITGTLTGTGYKLTWAAGSAFGVKDAAVEYNVPLTLPRAAVSPLKMTVTPVATTSGNIPSGPSQALVNMVLNYS